VYVSDSGIHSVVCLNLEGELVRTFSAPEFSPRGVTVDQANGNVYVCEYNSESVLRLNCDLVVVEKLKLKGDTLQNLMAISHCSKTDRLAVSSESTPFVKVLPDFEGLCKQFGSRWDATERGVSSGSKLFAILIVVFEKKVKKMMILEIQQKTF